MITRVPPGVVGAKPPAGYHQSGRGTIGANLLAHPGTRQSLTRPVGPVDDSQGRNPWRWTIGAKPLVVDDRGQPRRTGYPI